MVVPTNGFIIIRRQGLTSYLVATIEHSSLLLG